MAVLAAIAVADTTKLTAAARAAIDLIVFSSAPIGNGFDDEDSGTVFGDGPRPALVRILRDRFC